MRNKIKNAFLWLKRKTLIRTRIRLFFENIQIEKELKERNAQYKNIHQGERCFIIGTGPSIKDQDLSLLKNEWTFAVNSLYLHQQYGMINPKFYSLICSEIFKEDIEAKKYLDNISGAVTGGTLMILPFQYKDVVEKRELFSKNKKLYIAQNSRLDFRENGRFNIDIEKQIPSISNVVHSAIIAANYMGFKTICLLGVEHDWLVKKSHIEGKTQYYQEHHFHEGDKAPKIPVLDVIMPYEKICEGVGRAFKIYRLLKQKMPDVKIFNLTPGSYLDVFPFQKYEDVMGDLNDKKHF
jgi:hypothetical protein